MSNDEFDRRRAAGYAWRWVKPGETLSETEPPEGGKPRSEAQAEAGEADESERKAFWREARGECAALAGAVDRVWILPLQEQVQPVSSLLLRAHELGLKTAAMQDFPLQSVRLLRLAIRCRQRLPKQTMEAARGCVLWMHYGHPEVVDLLAEVTLAGEYAIAGSLQMALGRERRETVARVLGASARFARLLDEAQSAIARRYALRWLDISGVRDAVPALLRTLKGRHFSLSYWALELLEREAPEAVSAADITFLVKQIEAHPPPDIYTSEENRRAHAYFPDELRGVIARVRPAGAAEPLARIADSDREGPCGEEGFSGAWALSALAAAFPEQAVLRIDRLFRHRAWDQRMRAAKAAGHLPDAFAWPRLLEAAADAVPEIAAHAQEVWLARRNARCPLDALAGVEVALLEHPPSERMLSRLSVLRRAPLAARAAMMQVFLGEAPDTEALVLLLFAANDSRLYEQGERFGLPGTSTKLCQAIVAGFGAPSVQGLCANAARYPEGLWGWLGALADVVDEQQMPEATHAALRAVASRCVAKVSEASERAELDFDARLQVRDALRILAGVGMPPDLALRLWPLAQDSVKMRGRLRGVVRDALARAWSTLPAGEARLEGTVIAELTNALEARDLPRFANTAFFGLRLGLAAAVALSEQALSAHMDAAPSDPATTDALEVCMNELERLGRLHDRLRLTVAQPGTVAFCLAARQGWLESSPEEIELLRKAMHSEDSSTAAEAAIALLHAHELDAHGEPLIALAGRAPLRLRSELVWWLLFEGVAPRKLWPFLAEILVSADPDVSDRFDSVSYRFADSDVREDFIALLPNIASEHLYGHFARHLPRKEPESYWEDEENAADDDGSEDQGEGDCEGGGRG